MLGDLLLVFGAVPVVILGFALMCGGPIALVVLFAHLVAHGRRGAVDGLVFGLWIAFWASACWFLVPYCGMCASLPGLTLSMRAREPENPWVAVAFIHVVNFTFWPGVGWLLFFVREMLRRKPAADRSR